MARSSWIALALTGIAVGNVTADEPKQQGASPKSIAAPIAYEDLMLVVADANGIAAIVFEKQFDERSRDGKIQRRDVGTHYRFRFLAKGANEVVMGSGVVREKYRTEPTENPLKFNLFDEGSVTTIKAKSVNLLWSVSTKEVGYVYYVPEETRVQIAQATDFDTIDLKRFSR